MFSATSCFTYTKKESVYSMVCLRVFCNAKYILINVALAQNIDAGMCGLPLSASSPVIQRAL